MATKPIPSPLMNNKKLQNFFKEKEKSSARYKSILAFIEAPDRSEEEEKKFFNEHYEAVFSVTVARFTELEEEFKKVFDLFDRLLMSLAGKRLKDLLSLLLVLKKIITILAPYINARWQIEKIGNLIQRCLLRSNLHSVRLQSFELLLYFIEALQNSLEEYQISLFASAINLSPFIPPDNKVLLRTESYTKLAHSPEPATNPLDSNDPLYPTTDPPSKQDSIDLLDCFMDFISNKSNNFLFWFNLFKEKYLKMFYPRIFQELRLMDRDDDTGFKLLCPPEIQAVLIDRMAAWGERPQIFSTVWDPTLNGPIMLEIHKQTCQLPMSFGSTIKKSMQLYRGWLMNFQKNKIFADKLQQYWQAYIKSLALIFTTPSTLEEVETQHSLCREVLIIYTYFVVELAAKLTKETWESLQYTVLLTTFDLINKTMPEVNPNAQVVVELLKKQSPNPLQRNGTSDTFADHLFAAVYFFWIRSQITNEDMWKDMSKKVAFCTDWKANLNQWKEKVLQLTYILKDFLYENQDKSREEDDNFTLSRTTEDEVFLRSTGKTKRYYSETGASQSSFVRDPRLTAMTWTAQTIKDTWYTMLNILGNPTKISEPSSYEVAMSCIYEVVEILVDAEEKQPLQVAPPIPIMKVFLPWLIEACTYDEQLIKGLLIAYRALLTLFCRRHHTDSSELSHLLSHFYRIIQMGLNNTNSAVVWAVLEYSTSIFSYDLPGVAVLIPDFIREIEVLCGPMNMGNCPAAVKQNALTIVNSLICYPNHFDGLQFPVAEIIRPYESFQREPFWTSDTLKEKISKVLLNFLSSLNEEPHTYVISLCGSTVFIYEELSYPSPKLEIISKFLNLLVEFPQHPNETVAITASECLGSLALLHNELAKLDKNVVMTTIGKICDMIVKLIRKDSPPRETVISMLLIAARDWLLSSHNDFLAARTHKAFFQKVYTTLEICLLGDLAENLKQKKPSKKDGSDKKALKKLKNVVSKSKDPSMLDLFDDMSQEPLHGSSLIRETAEMVLLQLLLQFNNSPSLSMVTSSTAAEDEKSIHFSYNDSLVFSFSEVERKTENSNCDPPPEHKAARLVVRDAFGKFIWETTLVIDVPKRLVTGVGASLDKWKYKPNSSSPLASRGPRLSMYNIHDAAESSASDTTIVSSSPPESSQQIVSPPSPKTATEKSETNTTVGLPSFNRTEKELPKYTEGANFVGVDMVSQLLKFLSETLPPSAGASGPVYPDPKSIGKPEVDATYLDSVNDKVSALEAQAEKEDASNAKERAKLPIQSSTCVPLSTFHTCRLLLNNLGLLTHRNAKKFHLLENSSRLIRALKELDSQNGRDIFKIGVLYVAPGQEEQRDILKNEGGSELYSEFIRGIGWQIELASHAGFTGGLDRSVKDTIYYSSPTNEVIYHIPTLMPTIASDEKQIEKKMHVGNDYVHVVWSEHKRDYKPTTITSQWIDTHIVVYPLPSGLFRVQIYHKSKIPFFGPLLDGMVLDKKTICPLIRQTAINASSRSKNLTIGFKRPYSARVGSIKDLIQKNKADKTVSDLLAGLYPTQRQ